MRTKKTDQAARIIVTESQYNYGSAKRKAAERLGMKYSRPQLPSNLEVEQELRVYQRLYGGDDHDQTLSELRRSAIQAMQFFDAFKPKLVGPVLAGTADHNSRITLHLFSDDPDAVARFLYDQNIPFEHESRRIRWHDNGFQTMEVLCIERAEQTVELCLFTTLDQRQAPPSPVDGRPQHRATLAEVEYLLNKPLI